ncbi:MAG TPA: hypothetical protein ENJ50_08680, partial [Planctomycetaceae bacterium]|nr:hypothetical protein [Planctomycetaceae bacterium]
MEPGTGSTNGRHGDAFWTVLVAIVGSSLFSGLSVTRADFATSSRPTLAPSTPTRSLRMLHDDLIDGQLDDFSLLEAALRCGGVGDVREIQQFEGSF